MTGLLIELTPEEKKLMVPDEESVQKTSVTALMVMTDTHVYKRFKDTERYKNCIAASWHGDRYYRVKCKQLSAIPGVAHQAMIRYEKVHCDPLSFEEAKDRLLSLTEGIHVVFWSPVCTVWVGGQRQWI